MKKMSYLMLSGLIVTSFLTVNCQKSPSKRGIKSRSGLEDIKIDVKPGENKATNIDRSADPRNQSASQTATTAEQAAEKAKMQVCTDDTAQKDSELKKT